MAVPVISEALRKRTRLSLATQGGDLGSQLIDLVERALEISTISLENATFTQPTIQLNEGGDTANLSGGGISFFGDSAQIVGFIRISEADITNLEVKAPGAGILTLDINSDSTLLMDANFSVNGASAIDQDVQVAAFPTWGKVSVTGLDIVLDSDGFPTTLRSSSTAGRVITFPDATGTIALTSDIVAEALSATLAVGNTTGPTDLIISSGQKLQTNEILETSNGFGVTIDGVKALDNELIFGNTLAKIGSPTANRLHLYAGSGTSLGGNEKSFLDLANATLTTGFNFSTIEYNQTSISLFVANDAANAGLTAFNIVNGGSDVIKIGFFGVTPAARPTITGSRGGNVALADLLTELASLGLVIDSTS